jgi:hypothetical protein
MQFGGSGASSKQDRGNGTLIGASTEGLFFTGILVDWRAKWDQLWLTLQVGCPLWAKMSIQNP